MTQAQGRLTNGGGLCKLDGSWNMLCIWWFLCDEIMVPAPSYLTQAMGKGYGGVWVFSREVGSTLRRNL